MSDNATAIARLKSVRQSLLSGTLSEEVEYAGRRVKRAQVDLNKLNEEIARLEAEDAGKAQRGAIGFIF